MSTQCSTSVNCIRRGYPSRYFGENQLSPGLVSLSLQPTDHPNVFQHVLVRSSTSYYRSFILSMGSSPGFGSTAGDSIALLTLAFASAPHRGCLTLPHTVTRRLIMQKACGHPEGLPQFVSVRFQVLFHSPQRGTFHLSLTVLVHYRSSVSI